MAEGHDLTLLTLFREEAELHLPALEGALSLCVSGKLADTRAFAEQCSYIRGAAVCAELAALARVLDWVEQSAFRGEFRMNQASHAMQWIRDALAVETADIGRWNDARDEDSRRLVEAWESGTEPAAEGRASSAPGPAAASVPAAEAPAAAIDPAMMELFRSEVESHTFAMSDGLIALDADPSAMERLEGVMRAAHSIKGAARILTIDPAVTLAHIAEERMQDALRAGEELDPSEIEALLAVCDIFSALAKVPAPREWAFANQPRFDTARQAIIDRGQQRSDSSLQVMSSPSVAASAIPERRSGATAARARFAEHLASSANQSGKEGADAATGDTPRNAGSPASAEGGSAVATPTSGDVSRPHDTARPVTTGKSAATSGEKSEADAAHAHRTVKVSTVHLERLLGLAGEGVMDAREFAPFARLLHQVALQQTTVLDLLSELNIALGPVTDDAHARGLLSRARSVAEDVRTAISQRHIEADDYSRRSDELARRIYRETIESRMRPFKDGVQWFPRLVFDIARKLEKSVDFRILGDMVRVDRDILEKLEAPLNHLLRNALDHGVEMPAERRQAGKPERASLTVEAKHWAGMLSVTVSDDGRGIAVERVRSRIIERRLTTEEEAQQLNDAQVLEYLFAPGFSTRDSVSELSGRGVGLDVVKTATHEVGGSVRIHSTPGKGTSFQLLLPLTLSVTRAVIVRIAGEDYAVPLVRVHRLVRTEVENLIFVEGRPCLDVEGERLGLISGCEVLGFPVPEPSAVLSVVVLRNYLGSFGIVVDAVIGEQDLVVRTLDSRLGRVSDVLAAAILPDGRPVLILDTEDLMRSVAHMVDQRQLSARHETRRMTRQHILVVDDSVTVREVEKQLLLANGYDVTVAIDGAEAWQLVRVKDFDLVVSDVDMPRMDGLELTRSIRRDVRLRTMPIVIVSYRDKPEDRVRAEEAGATRYLPKSSFHEDALLDLVRELAGTRQ